MLNQNYLKPGDLVQVISPSGCLRELDTFNKVSRKLAIAWLSSGIFTMI
ncbi:hypothetical protein ACP6PL_05440 [Dapis sp. BLCC M126]